MKPNEANKPDESVLFSGTCVSDAGTWFNSLVRQLRELREERSNPHAPVQITAEKDMSALDKLIEIARGDSDVEIRKRAMFWLGQSRDPKAIQFLHDLILR